MSAVTMATDYWRGPEGIRRRVEMLGEDFCFNVVNNALQAYGRVNEIAGWIWVGSMDERQCDYCYSRTGNFYRQGMFLPRLPAHAGCRCEWQLMSSEEEPIVYAAKLDLRVIPVEKRPNLIKVYIRTISARQGQQVNREVISLEETTIGKTKIQAINNPQAEYKQILLNTVEKIPIEHLEGIPNIRLVSRGEDNHISGVINNETREITVYDGYVEFDKTVYHEVGHNLYQNLISDSAKQEWNEMWQVAAENTRTMKSYDLPSDYATVNPDEGFAESYAFISKYQSYKGKGGVPIVAKNIYDWFEKEVFP